ncbi:MAG: GTPase [Caldilineaceae bacterium]
MSKETIVAEIRQKLEEANSTKVSVALLGRTGVGKSSLINALVGQEVATVSIQTDTTTAPEEYEWNHLIFVDLPGYNTQSFPAETFYQDFGLAHYDLILCVWCGKIEEQDVKIFQKVMAGPKPFLLVRSKWDTEKQRGKSKLELATLVEEDFATQFGRPHPLFFVAVDPEEGLDVLQDAIIAKLDDVKKTRWYESAKAYSKAFLAEKRKRCERKVYLFAALAAATSAIPIPGLGVAVDIGSLLALFELLKKDYGVNELTPKEVTAPALAKIASEIIEYSTKEGALLLLKRYASQVTVEEFSKYIPVVGQAIAASAGFYITNSAGMAFLRDCHILAEARLDVALTP